MTKLYIPITKFRGEDMVQETMLKECSFSLAADNIATGQWEEIERVIEVDLEAGTSRDASTTIAREAAKIALDYLDIEDAHGFPDFIKMHRPNSLDALVAEVQYNASFSDEPLTVFDVLGGSRV